MGHKAKEIEVARNLFKLWRGVKLAGIHCPFHDDTHPSAYVLLYQSGKALIKCHACQVKVWGRWREDGGQVLINITGTARVVRREEKEVEVSNPAFALLVRAVRAQAKAILSGSLLRPSRIMSEYLRWKLHGEKIPEGIPNPPHIGMAIFFWLSKATPPFELISAFHVRVNCHPKALTIFFNPEDKIEGYVYAPFPGQIRKEDRIVITESPFQALWLAGNGYHTSISALGKQNVISLGQRLTRLGYDVLAFVDENPAPPFCFVIDLDKAKIEDVRGILCRFLEGR